MLTRVLIALYGNEISARFDLTTEVLIASLSEDSKVVEEKTVVLPQASAEGLIHMIMTEDVKALVCGAIEEELHQFLTWKRVEVFDSVMGTGEAALERFREGKLMAGDILFERVCED